MLAARMHGYKQPLVLEEIKVPEFAPDQVLVVRLTCDKPGRLSVCKSADRLTTKRAKNLPDIRR